MPDFSQQPTEKKIPSAPILDSTEKNSSPKNIYATTCSNTVSEKKSNNHRLGKKFPPEPYTPDEIQKMLAACPPTSFIRRRNRAMVILLWRSGIRSGELLDLVPHDLDLSRCSVRVLRGKGGESRLVGIDQAAAAAMAEWIEFRAAAGKTGRQPLFCTYRGERIYPSYLGDMLKRLARDAGLSRRVHPHAFRHTHASELRQENVEIGLIKKQLGHKWLSTTAIYLDHVCPQAVIDTMRAREW